jgi:hypothetical protein
MNPKSGKAGKAVTPAAPDKADDADSADPGKVAEIKAEQLKTKSGKYGSEQVKPYKGGQTQQDETEEQTGTEQANWIEIEMVGEDDEPIPGMAYRITLPDGETVAEGTLDENGFVRLDGIDEGTCKVCFPELDKDAWEFVESLGPR